MSLSQAHLDGNDVIYDFQDKLRKSSCAEGRVVLTEYFRKWNLPNKEKG